MGREAQRLMDLLVHGGALTVGFTDLSGGHESATFPLGGLAEALLWIDTHQHRLPGAGRRGSPRRRTAAHSGHPDNRNGRAPLAPAPEPLPETAAGPDAPPTALSPRPRWRR